MEEDAFLKGGDGVRYLEAKVASRSWRALEKAPCLTAVCWLEGKVGCWYMVGVKVLLAPALEHHKLEPEDVGFQPLFVD